MIKTHKTNQFAYAGKFSVRNENTGLLLKGKPSFVGGATIHRPRIYETLKSAEEAASSIRWTICEAVELVD